MCNTETLGTGPGDNYGYSATTHIVGPPNASIIGASRSKPHTYHSYEKIAVLCMYVCIYVCVCVVLAIRHPRAHHTVAHCACANARVSMRVHKLGKDRQRSPRVNSKCTVLPSIRGES